MSPIQCSMPHCRHNKRTDNCTLHTFPVHEPLRSLWIKACRRVHKEPDDTITPWKGPGLQAAICVCHFSTMPGPKKRGRASQTARSLMLVPDVNLPDRDWIVARKATGPRTKRKQGSSDYESDDEEEDDDEEESSSRLTPSDHATLTAMEASNSESLPYTPRQSTDDNASTNSEIHAKRARKSTKGTARKSGSNTGKHKDLAYYSIEFLEDLAPAKDEIYKAPPAPESLDLQVEHHLCNACGFQFVLESSLRNHVARNVLRISYMCRHCPDILTFTNRCALLNHCLNHDPDIDRDMICRKATVQPLKHLCGAMSEIDLSLTPYQSPYFMDDSIRSADNDVDQAGSSSRPVGRDSVDESGLVADSASSPQSCAELTDLNSAEKPDTDVVDEPMTPVNEEETKVDSVECPECGLKFMGGRGLYRHFCSFKAPSLKFRCAECPMLFSSPCSLSAHVRSHSDQAPYVCFVCASEVAQPVFRRHLAEKCLAYCRSVIVHCTACMLKFTNVNECMNHCNTEHGEGLFHSISYLYTNKILNPLADKLPHQTPNRLQLMIAISAVRYNCLVEECAEKPYFTSRKELLSHYREKHRQHYRPYLCNECDFDAKSGARLASHIHECHESVKATNKEIVRPNVCPICQHECADYAEIYRHREEHETSDGKFWCFVCRDVYTSKQALVQHELICTRQTDENGELLAFLCSYCSKTFLQKDDLENHLVECHENTPYPCGICGLTYTNEEDLLSHTSEEHSQEKGKLPYVCQVCEKRNIEKAFSSAIWLKRHIFVVHKGRSAQSIPDEIHVDEKAKSPDYAVRLKRVGESVFTCAKCKFQTEDRPTFRTHISSHKSEGGVQCPDCGLNFIVQSSLKNHLLMVHKILDVAKHMNEHGLDDKNGAANVENSLKCSVCQKVFEDLQSVKTHMRSHGMAFINMRRSGSFPSKTP